MRLNAYARRRETAPTKTLKFLYAKLSTYSDGLPHSNKAIFEKSPYGYIGYIEELPGANTRGATLEEAKENLAEAVQLVLEANRKLTEEENKGKEEI